MERISMGFIEEKEIERMERIGMGFIEEKEIERKFKKV